MSFQLAYRVAEHLGHAGIDKSRPALHVVDPDPLPGRLDDPPVSLLTPPKCLLGELALADIPQGSHEHLDTMDMNFADAELDREGRTVLAQGTDLSLDAQHSTLTG